MVAADLFASHCWYRNAAQGLVERSHLTRQQGIGGRYKLPREGTLVPRNCSSGYSNESVRRDPSTDGCESSKQEEQALRLLLPIE